MTRATVMAVGYLLLDLVDLRAAPMSALAAAAAAMIVASPVSVADPGFLLTVCATGAIVLLAGRLIRGKPSGGWSSVRHALLALVAASVATELVLLPIAAALFGRITGAGPLLNLIAVPAMAVLQQAGLIAIVTDCWWPAAGQLLWLDCGIGGARARGIVALGRLGPGDHQARAVASLGNHRGVFRRRCVPAHRNCHRIICLADGAGDCRMAVRPRSHWRRRGLSLRRRSGDGHGRLTTVSPSPVSMWGRATRR